MLANCEQWRKKIDRFIVAAREPVSQQWYLLRCHLAQCDACRAYYDRLRSAEELWAGDQGSIGPADERLLDAVLRSAQKNAFWPRPMVMAAATAAAVLLLTAAFLWWNRQDQQGEFTARGMNRIAGGPQIRLLCINHSDQDPADVIDLSAVRSPQEIRRGCSRQGIIKFLYSNPAQGSSYLFLIGLTEKGQVRYYFPSPGENTSFPINQGVVDQSFAQGIRLNVNHQAELVRIYALFSQQPLSMGQVEGALLRGYRVQDRAPDEAMYGAFGPEVLLESTWVRIVDE